MFEILVYIFAYYGITNLLVKFVAYLVPHFKEEQMGMVCPSVDFGGKGYEYYIPIINIALLPFLIVGIGRLMYRKFPSKIEIKITK